MAQGWKTVRVFISSTFRDMHAERDYLVRVVFPELRERCARRRLHLVDVDLRWGVTEEEAEQGKVLEVILDEIDRSRPFFVAMLGERYGSVPDSVPEEARFAHPWLGDYPAHSLTALEIVHGVLRNPDTAKRSFFYLRDPPFIALLSESKRTDFAAESAEAGAKLAALKDEIRRSGRPIMEDYPCRWDDDRGRLVDLDVFGARVLEDLWGAICEEYPEEVPEADPVAMEREMHEAFAEERSSLHVGRTEEAGRLTEYVQGADRRPIVITGGSGCGKSAFLANWYRRYAAEHPDDFVLAYFVGASPDSTNHLRLLRNMCQELRREFALAEELPEDDKKLSETLAALLAAASRGKSRVVVLVDALDQLLPLEAAHGLGWLLDYIPEKARLVMSSLEVDCLDVLRRREVEEITLPSLSIDERRQIVRTLLGEWRRKLDERQMAALLAHRGVENPLYLRVAMEELRLFGRFEELSARIKALAEDIPGLFEQVLARLEEDHGHHLVAEAFALLGCSRYGLSEVELMDLLPGEGQERLPRALWARLARGAGAYLVRRGELLGFLHRQLSDAVVARYPNRKEKHAKLAAYFERAPPERKLDEYPYQLQQAEQWQALADALSDLDFFEYAWEHDRTYEWIGYWRSLEGRHQPGPCYQSAVEARVDGKDEIQRTARLTHAVSAFLYKMGLYTSALPFARQALVIKVDTLGENHPDSAASLNNLARIGSELGQYREAAILHQRALEVEESTLDPNDPRIASSLNNLAAVYIKQGKHAKALPLLQRALTISEAALGSDHPNVAIILDNLGGLYSYEREHSEAERCYQRALEIEERVLGSDHPQLAASLNNLAALYVDWRRRPEALPLLERALTIYERTLGQAHPAVASNLNNLALLYSEEGRWKEARRLQKRAVAIANATLGRFHPDTSRFESNQRQFGERIRLPFPGMASLVVNLTHLSAWIGAAVAVAFHLVGGVAPKLQGMFLIGSAVGYVIGRRAVAKGAVVGAALVLAVYVAAAFIHASWPPARIFVGTADVTAVVMVAAGAAGGAAGAAMNNYVTTRLLGTWD